MTLRAFRDLLLTVGIPVFHHEADKQTDTYAVWSEQSADRYTRDNQTVSRVFKIRVSVFTKTEFDETLDLLERTLERAGIVIDGPAVRYERDTLYTGYFYDCEVNDGN